MINIPSNSFSNHLTSCCISNDSQGFDTLKNLLDCKHILTQCVVR